MYRQVYRFEHRIEKSGPFSQLLNLKHPVKCDEYLSKIISSHIAITNESSNVRAFSKNDVCFFETIKEFKSLFLLDITDEKTIAEPFKALLMSDYVLNEYIVEDGALLLPFGSSVIGQNAADRCSMKFVKISLDKHNYPEMLTW